LGSGLRSSFISFGKIVSMAYSHLLVYIYFVFLSIISNFVRLFSTFNTSGFLGI